MNVIKVGTTITVVLDDGVVLSKPNCTKELEEQIWDAVKSEDKEQILYLLSPKAKEALDEIKDLEEFEVKVGSSKYLTIVGSSIYIKSISELSLPVDLAKSILKAEVEGNKVLLESYLNFWTLVSLNPDSRARMNLFWFLKKYGMTITKSGLFVAYRNVEIKTIGKVINQELTAYVSDAYIKIKKNKKSPSNYFVIQNSEGYSLSKYNDGLESGVVCHGSVKELYESFSNNAEKSSVTIYTDNYTKSMEITIGKIVVMDRDKCDSVQENTCSRGLHVASKDWLLNNGRGFGNTTLLVLVNPASVVAVPPSDSYGKMRTCSYYPVKIVTKEELTQSEPIIPDGYEDDFINSIELGEVSNNDENPYFIPVPNIPELSEQTIIRSINRLKNFRKNVL